MADFPLVPENETPVPAPSVTVNNISNTYAFGAFTLDVTPTLAANSVAFALVLESDDETINLIGTVIKANAWFVDGDLDPSNEAGDLSKVSPVIPDVDSPGATFMLSFIDGEASFRIEHTGSARSWYVIIELNSYVTVLGPYILGA